MKAVTDKVKALKQSGVDTIVTYYPHCTGCVLTGISDSQTCFHNIRQYVIWQKNEEKYVQLFDECYAYLPEKGAKAFMALLSNNASKIMDEKLLPVEFEKLRYGKVQRFTSTALHSDFQDVTFYINGKIAEKKVDKYLLNTRWENDNQPFNGQQTTAPPGKAINLNYTSNQESYLKKLLDLAERDIEKMEFKRAL